MDTILLVRGNVQFPFTIKSNDTNSQKVILVKTTNIDVDLTATLSFSQDGVNDVPLTDAAGDAITLSIPASAGKAGIQLTDFAANYLHVSIAVASGKVVPVISAVAADNEAADSADIAATINPGGSETLVTVQIGTTEGNYSREVAVTQSPIAAGTSNVNTTLTIDELLPETEYFFRIKAVNAVGIVHSTEGTFTTIAE